MPETLTESFCERCGTRYTFESAAPRTARLKGIKVLSRGLKNYVLSDDTSMDEAMAAARSETDRESTSQQLDAFHKTFNFCMTCRQYTCANCWNESEGRCLSCAPHLGHEILPAPFPDLDPRAGMPALDATNGVNGSGAHDAPDAGMAAMAWPTSDLMREAEDAAIAAEAALTEPDVEPEPFEPIDAAARLAALGGVAAAADLGPEAPADSPTIATGSDVAASAAPEPDVPAPTTPEPVAPEAVAPVAAESESIAPDAAAAAAAAAAASAAKHAVDPADVEGRATAAAGQTSDLLRRFRPGQNLDDEIAAYEQEREAAAAAAAAATVAMGTPEPIAPEPVVPAEPVAAEPVAAEAVPPQPVTPEPVAPPAPVAAEPPAEPVAASAAGVDVVEQPTWRIVAPAEPDAPDAPAAPATPSAEPEWPTTPQWPSQQPSSGLPFLGRPAASGGIDALWAESAREVAAAPGQTAKAAGGVQPCVSCGLSLSATARFCRRCGTRQG